METMIAILLSLLAAVRTVPADAELDETEWADAPPPAVTMPADIPAVYRLPSAVRRELPEISLSLLAWHEEPERRFVKINGLRVAEGGVAGQELWVREIRRREVVLQYQTHLFIID